ncbi:hypothetical protein DFH06DRAFT_1385948, partial [Mycena polygramma]
PLSERWPMMLGLTAIVLTSWTGFLTYVTNETKVTSLVVKQILRTIKIDSQLLGTTSARVVTEWISDYSWAGAIKWSLGEFLLPNHYFWELNAHLGSGTVYFTNILKAEGIPYEILRFRVILDDGRVVEV